MRKQEICGRSEVKEHRPNLKESSDSRNRKLGNEEEEEGERGALN